MLSAVFAAVTLDFYGTVVHEDDRAIASICEQVAAAAAGGASAVDIARLWSAGFAQECGCSFGDAFKSQQEAARASLVRAARAVGSSADPDQLMTAQVQHWRQPPLYEDAREFLARIDLPVCIASNIDRSDLEAALDHHGLVFDHVVTSDDVRSYKPRPELFRRAMEHLGVGRDAMLHVGDSLSSDVAGANGIGVPVAWVNRSARAAPGEASLWAEVRNLVELADLLEDQPRRPS